MPTAAMMSRWRWGLRSSVRVIAKRTGEPKALVARTIGTSSGTSSGTQARSPGKDSRSGPSSGADDLDKFLLGRKTTNPSSDGSDPAVAEKPRRREPTVPEIRLTSGDEILFALQAAHEAPTDIARSRIWGSE